VRFDEFVARLRIGFSGPIPDPATPDTGLYDDMGLDSLAAFELIIAVETLAESLALLPEMPALFTLGDAFAYFEDLRAAEAELLGEVP
jgi:acyl carrier protein